jgi:hypothetical protein
MLVWILREYPLELRADFQQFYQLNIDDMGEAYTARHAADLALMLPPESRLLRIINPENAWNLRDHMLSSIEYSLRWLVWAQTKDGQKNRKRPHPIDPPKKKKSLPTEDFAVFPQDEYQRRLDAPRGEVNNVKR